MEGGSAAVLLAVPQQPVCGLDIAGKGGQDVRGGETGGWGGGGKGAEKAKGALAGGERFGGGVVGIEGVDPRKLVRILRTTGAQQGIIDSTGASPKALIERARKAPGMEGQDLATKVSTKAPYRWEQGVPGREPAPKRGEVVVVDYGVKRGILRQLVDLGCGVTVVPSRTPAAGILARKPDGVVLSNGPGDPAAVVGADVQARDLLGKVPVMGICLGNQILALAMGGKTYKLKFGQIGRAHV